MAELWDVYDRNRNRTGRFHERGKPLLPGEYHLVVNICLMDGEGRVLLTKRHPKKHWGGYWECTGGAVIAGENSLQAAVREVREEIGVVLDPADGVLLSSDRRSSWFLDTWLFPCGARLEDLVFQPDEVVDAKWADEAEYRQMRRRGVLVHTIPFFYERAWRARFRAKKGRRPKREEP